MITDYKTNYKTKIIDFFISHIKTRIILICVFPLWFSFGNNFFGTTLKLKQDGEMTPRGWVVNGIAFVLYVILNIIIGYIPKRNESLSKQKENDLKAFRDTVAINDKLIDITSELCSHKLSKITQNIKNIQNNASIYAFSPLDHLNEISYKIQDCVSCVTGIPKKRL